MWILEADAPNPATFHLAAGAVSTIGRGDGAEFIVEAPLVSRLHCELAAALDVIRVKDLDSTNGTFVNGKRIQSATVRAGDVLQVGRVALRISKTD